MLNPLSSALGRISGRSYKSDILDILYPNLCASCGHMPPVQNALCTACEDNVDYLEDISSCELCGVPFGYFKERTSGTAELPPETEGTHLCSKCLSGRYSFNRARSVTVYQGPVREMVHAFKYEGKLKTASSLTGIMLKHMPFDLGGFDVLVPVPLYITKLRQRQYNQSAVLASQIEKSSGLRKDIAGLVKVRDTRPQIEIKDEAGRRRNVRGAFKVREGCSFKGLSVLLLDDVFTTGSTSDECSKTLLKSGALSVEVLTLSRARGI